MKFSYKQAIDIYTDHVEFLQDQYKLILDNISDEEISRPDISKKLKRLKFKILELNELIKTEEQITISDWYRKIGEISIESSQ